MRILILLLFLLFGCSSEETKVTSSDIEYTEVSIEDILLLDGETYDSYGGTVVTADTSNSILVTAHTKMDCVLDNGVLKPLRSPCRKADFRFPMLTSDSLAYIPNREIKYEFNFTLLSYNLSNPPEWVIVFQDWVDIDPSDTNGNHPITTLKLIPSDTCVLLQHFDNSWQFGYDFGDDWEDRNHSLHQANTPHGKQCINIGESYNIKILIQDGNDKSKGNFKLFINGRIVSNVSYQTKFRSITSNAVNGFGIYLNKGYDIGLSSTDFPTLDKQQFPHVLWNQDNQISILFDDFHRYVRILKE